MPGTGHRGKGLSLNGHWGTLWGDEVFYDLIVVVVTRLYIFVKTHQTVHLKRVSFPEHKSCSPKANILKTQTLLFLPPVLSCLISRQGLPQGCFLFPVTCALHPSHIPQLLVSSWTLISLLLVWITLIYPSGSQLNLFPKEAKIKTTWPVPGVDKDVEQLHCPAGGSVN